MTGDDHADSSALRTTVKDARREAAAALARLAEAALHYADGRIADEPDDAAGPHPLAALDEQAVEAAQTRSPKQLRLWLLRLVVRLEPLAFEQRHRRALEERRVTVVQGVDGLGYVTGEVSAADAAAIDGLLAATARSLGADDPRTEQQRRSDLFADLLLGRLAFDHYSRKTVMSQPMSPIGLKSRTLTLKPASCLAPNCNASTGTVNRSAKPSMWHRRCFQVAHPSL